MFFVTAIEECHAHALPVKVPSLLNLVSGKEVEQDLDCVDWDLPTVQSTLISPSCTPPIETTQSLMSSIKNTSNRPSTAPAAGTSPTLPAAGTPPTPFAAGTPPTPPAAGTPPASGTCPSPHSLPSITILTNVNLGKSGNPLVDYPSLGFDDSHPSSPFSSPIRSPAASVPGSPMLTYMDVPLLDMPRLLSLLSSLDPIPESNPSIPLPQSGMVSTPPSVNGSPVSSLLLLMNSVTPNSGPEVGDEVQGRSLRKRQSNENGGESSPMKKKQKPGVVTTSPPN